MAQNWTKPSVGRGIDWSNPLSRSLALALIFNEGGGNPSEILGNKPWTLAGTTGLPSWTPTPDGPGLSFVAANSQQIAGPNLGYLGLSNTSFTISWRAQCTSSADGIGAILCAANDNRDVVYHRPTADLIAFAEDNFTTWTWTYAGSSQAKWHSYAMTLSGKTVTAYVDGISLGTNTITAWSWSNGTAQIGMATTIWPFNGTIDYVLVHNRPLVASEIALISVNPWQIFQPVTGWMFNPLTSTSYTLAGALGTFTETGTAANLLRARSLLASFGSFTETGTAANLLRARFLTASPGVFAETGTAANFLRARSLIVAAGSFSETGISANLGSGRHLTGTFGVFSQTGQSANLFATVVSVVFPGTCDITYAAVNNVQFAMASLEIQYAPTTVDVQTR